MCGYERHTFAGVDVGGGNGVGVGEEIGHAAGGVQTKGERGARGEV
jgi:hypothetical protein